jgi:hypothetical protein
LRNRASRIDAKSARSFFSRDKRPDACLFSVRATRRPPLVH